MLHLKTGLDFDPIGAWAKQTLPPPLLRGQFRGVARNMWDTHPPSPFHKLGPKTENTFDQQAKKYENNILNN